MEKSEAQKADVAEISTTSSTAPTNPTNAAAELPAKTTSSPSTSSTSDIPDIKFTSIFSLGPYEFTKLVLSSMMNGSDSRGSTNSSTPPPSSSSSSSNSGESKPSDFMDGKSYIKKEKGSSGGMPSKNFDEMCVGIWRNEKGKQPQCSGISVVKVTNVKEFKEAEKQKVFGIRLIVTVEEVSDEEKSQIHTSEEKEKLLTYIKELKESKEDQPSISQLSSNTQLSTTSVEERSSKMFSSISGFVDRRIQFTERLATKIFSGESAVRIFENGKSVMNKQFELIKKKLSGEKKSS